MAGQSRTRFKEITLAMLLAFSVAESLERQPWIDDPWYMHVGGDLGYNYFTSVNNGFAPKDYHSNNVLFDLFARVPFMPLWDGEVEIEFWRTSKKNFGFESAALQVRYQFLDDIAGDRVSLTVGGNVRFVPMNRLRDVATPYHNLFNFELTGALGKEVSKGEEWILHTYLFGAIGQANRGYPWINASFDLRGKIFSLIELGGFLRGYFGLGHATLINVSAFKSYADFAHRNVDAGALIALDSRTSGRLSFEYAGRVYAHSFPSGYNSFTLRYEFPFSF